MRLEPLTETEFADVVRRYVDNASELAREAAAGRGDDTLAARPPLNVLRTIAHDPTLFARVIPQITHLGNGALTPRQREMVILRTAYWRHGDYVRVHHRVVAKGAGVSARQIAELDSARFDRTVFADDELVLLDAVDQLHTSSTISDTAWNALREHHSAPIFLELLFLHGLYCTLSIVTSSLQVAIDPWLADPGAEG